MPLPSLKAAIQAHGPVAHPFEGFIFLCGGAIDDTEDLQSARHFVVQQVRSRGDTLDGKHVIVAERVTDLLEGTDFSDLLEFEEYLAALASCIVIFVESPGSIAELGCFSVMEHISPKLLVIFEQAFVDGAPSFISRGPVQQLRRFRDGAVQAFPMSDDPAAPLRISREYLEGCWGDIQQAIAEAAKSAITDAALDPSKLPHRLLLISDLVNLLVACRLRELLEALEYFECFISQGELARSLKLLQKFGLLTTSTYGRETFYVSLDEKPRISYRSAVPGKIFDRERFQVLISANYQRADERKAKMLTARAKRAAA